MRAALATAELDDADLRELFHELTFIKTDVLDPSGRLAMSNLQSHANRPAITSALRIDTGCGGARVFLNAAIT